MCGVPAAALASSAPPAPLAAAPAAARPLRVPLAGSAPPEAAALLVRDDAAPVALVGRWAGAAAIVASEPTREAIDPDDTFALLDALPAVDGAPDGFVGGGWIGMLGYGLGRALQARDAPAPGRPGERLPSAVLRFYDHVLRLDTGGTWWFEALWTEARADALERRLALLADRVRRDPEAPGRVRTGPWRASPSPAGHARAVAACRERIAAGDLFQANLALRLRAPLLAGEAADILALGVAALRPDRAAWVAGPWGAAASLSPELLVAERAGRVRTAPIKGTRPRPADPGLAEQQRTALAGSEKDRAENVMIVDLMRNDLGRVCEAGSVRVAQLAEVRPHAGVWHLVSEVEGRLRPDVRRSDLARAVFPPGSVTGAPKLAAMDVISELEGVPRQAFCGAFGLASPTAGLELSVAIRTFEVRDGHVWLDVGGGVVADSDPAAEAAECLAKAAPLLAAIGGELAGAGEDGPGGELAADDEGGASTATPAGGPGAPATPPAPCRTGPRPTPRPDPEQGVFESIRVVDGVAVAACRHLARMAASARELYGVEVPGALRALVEHTALEQGGPCRLRVLLDPDGAVALDVGPLPAAATSLALEPVALAGGLGAHKWRDRRLVDALDRETAPALPLLVDLDGLVLEATRASVIAVVDGTLVTPPLDGRILPGVTRARIVEHALAAGIAVAERPLPLAELREAQAVLVVNALRGVELAGTLGGQPLPADQQLAQRLADHLAGARR